MKKKFTFGLMIVSVLLLPVNTLKGQTQLTPGGVANSSYTWVAWLTPDNYNIGIWKNLITTEGSAGDFSSTNIAPLKKEIEGFNFHPVLAFDKPSLHTAPNQLVSQYSANIKPSENITMIFVFQRKTIDIWDYLIGLSNCSDYNLLGWRDLNNNNITLIWALQGPNGNLGACQNGILTVDHPNINDGTGTKTLLVYKNGTKSTARAYQWDGTYCAGTKVAIGSGRNDSEFYGYQGNLQEVILLKKSNNGNIADNDIQKIHSYLAIKYGITLDHDYVNSDGIVVWNSTLHNGYNKYIFGIGRDNASRLNQVQSQSAESDLITVFKGTLGKLNNNNSNALVDKTFLMLGSNGLTDLTPYEYAAGTTFSNGQLVEKINRRRNLLYKAQVTVNGAGGSETVNLKVNSTKDQYVLISNNPSFPPSSTRIYLITNQIAKYVEISDNDYVAFAGYWSFPGGVSQHTILAWLTPDTYNAGTWKSVVPLESSVGNFSGAKIAPEKKNLDGFNFHPVVMFGKTTIHSAPNQLFSQYSNGITSTDNITMIFVFQRKTTGQYDHLIGFSASSFNLLGWRDFNSHSLTFLWRSGGGSGNIGTLQKGILTVDNPNINDVGSNKTMLVYKNGMRSTAQAYQQSADHALSKVGLGGGRGNEEYYGFQGNLQEVILIKKPNNGNIAAADMQRIHSYLAIKYGIPLDNADDYFNANGNVVWNRTLNNGYNHNIFGIGRDDATELYQKQSQSENDKWLTVFVGNKLEATNSENKGTLLNEQYLLFGAQKTKNIMLLTGVNNGDLYKNGTAVSSDGFNIQSCSYKTQLSGPSDTIRVKLLVKSSDFLYALVSEDENFTPAHTNIYPFKGKIAEIEVKQTAPFIKLIGFAPGPGNVSTSLKLWLRADDDAGLNIGNLPSSDPKLTAYPDLNKEQDPNNIPTVSGWSDLLREQTFSCKGVQNNSQRIPVYINNSPEMNYHPTIRFWANPTGNTYSSYLTNSKNIFNENSFVEGKHTAYFLVNCFKFNTSNPWTFQLAFGDTVFGVIPRPGYGVQQVGKNISGRFRTAAEEVVGVNDMFRMGATSILGYITNTKNTGINNPVTFRFNGINEIIATGFNWSNLNFSKGAMLGGLFQHDRTMQGVMSEVILYDRALDEYETQQLESYLALKYGVTLYPATQYGRFRYTFSDRIVIWDGNQPKGNRFADFYNNIAAVIRDDMGRLENRHAHSTNVGSLLHLGVAGSALSADGSGVGSLENDKEAVIFGNDGKTGTTLVKNINECSDFVGKFNRKWLIHKVAKDNRPVTMLVGAQNNYDNQLGMDENTTEYYTYLSANYEINLIVANSPEDLDSGIYSAIIPMNYINGEHQCNYTFTNEETFITFGWKPNKKGCAADQEAIFTETKKFDWEQWNINTNKNLSTVSGVQLSVNTPVDLGNDIIVTSTQVQYAQAVKANMGYPRAVNLPVKGALEVQRRMGVGQDVTITITLNHPVIPEFSIFDLDAYGAYIQEEVEIIGECASKSYMPVLSYATDKNNAQYQIIGNKAIVTKKTNLSPSDKKGTLNVTFNGGVSKIIIKYRTKGQSFDITKRILISPITLRSVPLPPPTNKDGLSFVKQVKENSITTCEAVNYTFYIQNTKCKDKTVKFSDTLPQNMKWEIGSIGLDAYSSELNPLLDVQIMPALPNVGESLQINELVIPANSTLIMTATAVFDDNAQEGEYANRATITYNNEEGITNFQTADKTTVEPYTIFYASCQEALNIPVAIEETYSRKDYREDAEIEVTYTLTNSNVDITELYLKIDFNEVFTHIANSFEAYREEEGIKIPVAALVTADPVQGTLMVAGDANGETGFTLQAGQVVVIKYKLKAPASNKLQYELDENGIATDKKIDLGIMYNFSSNMDDPCAIKTITNLQGSKIMPYCGEMVMPEIFIRIEK
ncbi:MAG: hypothetical protein FWC10_02765 [Lentimicrobiaceae bacterium]|nr:hypothetical protein [Lentimicrobiaceae bacterium]